MNNEEIEKERIKLVIEVMALAYLFQQKTNHAVFINYSGHVDSMEVKIVNSPSDYLSELAGTQFYTSGRFEDDRRYEPNYWLKVKRDVLKEALEERGIPYDDMVEVAHTVYSREF